MLPLKCQYKLFKLNKDFKEGLKERPVNWGFGGLSEFTFYRTYSRKKENGALESWADCVIRVVEGTFTVLKTHADLYACSWNERKSQRLAQEMAERIFTFKFTPPGRGLSMMGTPYVYERGGMALNNCAFVSTEHIETELSKPFAFLCDVSMCGVGCGFDLKGADKVEVHKPEGDIEGFVIEDTREGWCDALSCLIDSYLEENSKPLIFDYSEVRAEGELIKGFGGLASGPEPLRLGLEGIRHVLENRIGEKLTSVDIVDIMNLIGRFVVSGNVRRTAEIAFGEIEDKDFMTMKDWKQHPVNTGSQAPKELEKVCKEDYDSYNKFENMGEITHKYREYSWSHKFGGHRWASNNSIFAKLGMDYSKVGESIAVNGEPGIAWLDNMQKYSRMKDAPDNKDHRVRGGNPCLEQSLEHEELCTLVETFPAHHDDGYDFQRTLKFAFLYAKVVTLIPTHQVGTNDVIKRNRRIGCSHSGIQEAIIKFGRRKYLNEFCDRAYEYINYVDRKYSEWLGIPESVKKTSVKPSGTVSILAGALPGIHHAESNAYMRTVRLSKRSELLPILKEANYIIEDSVTDPTNTAVVYFPVLHDEKCRDKNSVSIWQQFSDAADMQRYWADNQVSITATFSAAEASQIPEVLSAYEDKLKGVSLLPISEHGYKQAPYQPRPRKEIKQYAGILKPLDFSTLTIEQEDLDSTKFCDSEGCAL